MMTILSLRKQVLCVHANVLESQAAIHLNKFVLKTYAIITLITIFKTIQILSVIKIYV